MEKVLSDIFSLSFDIVIPLSGCILAALAAAVLFGIRYITYLRNKRKYEKRERQKEQLADAAQSAEAPAKNVAG